MSTGIDRAIAIGHEIAGINSAINEGQIEFTNRGGARFDFYSTPLFEALGLHRAALRSELHHLFPTPTESEKEKNDE